MSEEFQQKAQKLMSKLSSLQPTTAVLQSRKMESAFPAKQSLVNGQYSLNDLHKFQEQLEFTDDDNKRKLKILNEQISKLQTYLLDENEARNKISQNFVLTATKVQKNMKITLQNIFKSYEQKQRKLQQKIEQILISQRKQLESHLSQNQSLIQQISALSKQLTSLEQQLDQMKRSRYLLQDKIYKQFIEQIKQLRKIYQRDLKQREERQNQLVQCLKSVYTSLMEQIRKQQMERQMNEKGFLTVVEQVIARIVQY